MRLQDKKTISRDVASQKKKQIDEGIAIAKKVDALRETVSQEEQRLERFRKESVVAVQKEIDVLIVHKNSLIEDIKSLEKEKKRLLIPLDAEWEEVNRKKKELFLLEGELYGMQEHLDQLRVEAERGLKEIELDKGRAEDMKHRASEALVQAEESLEKAHEVSATMRNKAQAILSSVELRQVAVAEQEEGMRRREEEVDRVWANVRAKETDLAYREIVLRDRYKELEKTITSLDISHG